MPKSLSSDHPDFHRKQRFDKLKTMALDDRSREYKQAELNYQYYDAKVRNWIARHGPQTTEMRWMEGDDLAGIYPTCVAQRPSADNRL